MISRLLIGLGALAVMGGCAAGATVAFSQASAAVNLVDAPNLHHALPAVVAVAAAAATPPAATAPPRATPAPGPTGPAVRASTPKPGSVKAAHVVAAAPAPALQRNLLTGPHGLNTRVGAAYTDCTGLSAVPHNSAFIDTCHTTAVLFVGHNHGVFTPLLSYAVGDVINWHDGTGAVHHLRIVAVRDVSSSVFPPVLGTYEFQTCRFATPNSPLDRDLDAVEE